MRNVLLIVCFSSFLLAQTVLLAASNSSLRPEIQENIRLLQETKSCPACDLSGAMLHRMKLAGANLEAANLAGAQLNLADLSGANLQGANLQSASLGGADLADANLTGANLTGAVIEGAYLVGAKMDGQIVVQRPHVDEGGPSAGEKVFAADKDKSKHLPFTNKATVAQANMQKAKIASVPPVESEQLPVQIPGEEKPVRSMPADPLPEKSKQLNMMGEAVIAPETIPGKIPVPSDGSMIEPSIKKKIMEENTPMEVAAVELEEAAEETGIEQKEADQPVVEERLDMEEEEKMAPRAADPVAEKKKQLVEKLLDDNRCVACDLAGVDLSGKDLEDADLERVNLEGAILRNTDFEGSNLKGANLRGADLRDADLREADMYRADVSGADLTGAKLKDALIDSLITTGVIGGDFKDARSAE